MSPSDVPAPSVQDAVGWFQALIQSNALVKIVAVLVIAIFLQVGMTHLIRKAVRRTVAAKSRDREGRRSSLSFQILKERREQRAEAIGQLIRSVFMVFLWVVVVLTVLPLLGIDVTPLLASASVIGVALAFGAQTLVKDYLSGIFLILEDQYGVGDMVDLGSAIGTIEEVTLRVTRLRDGSGVVWYVRNGEILRVANRSQGWTMATVDLPVAYDQNLDTVRAAVERVADEMTADPRFADSLLDRPRYAGVESVSGDAVFVRVIAKANPDDQVPLTREIRERIKQAFDAEGIRIPVVFRMPTPGGGPPSGSGGAPRA